MPRDIVVDTNVMMHAQNPAAFNHYQFSLSFLQKLRQDNTHLCIDEGFNIDSSLNKSIIGSEYLQNLVPGSIGYIVIVELALALRIKSLPRKPRRQEASNKINRLLRNKRDRTFLAVAYNSDERIFVSHDYKDFQRSKRNHIKRDLSICVINAEQCICDHFS